MYLIIRCLIIIILCIITKYLLKDMFRKKILLIIVSSLALLIILIKIPFENIIGFSSLESAVKYNTTNFNSIEFSYESDNIVLVGYNQKTELNIMLVKKIGDKYKLISSGYVMNNIEFDDYKIIAYKNNKIKDVYVIVYSLNKSDILVKNNENQNFIVVNKYYILKPKVKDKNYKILINDNEYTIDTDLQFETLAIYLFIFFIVIPILIVLIIIKVLKRNKKRKQ